MGLGETKRKTRLIGSAITKNSAWTNDASLPGQRLLSSMGWSQGQGLGTSSQGTSVPITMAFKMDNKGIGARRFEKEARSNGRADAWIGGGGELGDLFERLNKAGEGGSSTAVSVDSVPQNDEETEKAKRKREKAERKERKEKGEKKDRKSKSKGKGKEAEADEDIVEEAIEKVASALPHRMAHRARFLRAKRMVGNDLASVNEILGIASPTGSNSPAPLMTPPPVASPQPKAVEIERIDKSDIAESQKQKGKRKRTDEVGETESAASTSSDDKKARKEAKRLAKEAKREKKDRKRKSQVEDEAEGEEETPLTVPMEPSSDPSFKAGGGMKVSTMSVQDYLQSKLMKRRAALIRQKREEADIWKRAATISA